MWYRQSAQCIFRKGLNCLDIDIDQFACDMHFFFKLLNGREDYTSIEVITETAAAYAIKHVPTRWLSLKQVCVHVIDQ